MEEQDTQEDVRSNLNDRNENHARLIEEEIEEGSDNEEDRNEDTERTRLLNFPRMSASLNILAMTTIWR